MAATPDFSAEFQATVDALSDPRSMEGLYSPHRHGAALPSNEALREIIDLSRAILFPGYYGKSTIDAATVRYRIGAAVERFYHLLIGQVEAGLNLCAAHSAEAPSHDSLRAEAEDVARRVVLTLPRLRQTLATDVEAAYLGDPAANDHGEVISCYPVIKALTVYRLAHELHTLRVPLIPRILTELAHSETGIDIHPGAQIGEHFTIDHGTGVVIGETCIIGRNVKLYQGVTLGAKSFKLDADGHPIKGIARHPILEDDVIVYSNATILGRITIGRGAVIGGNLWVTEDVPPHTTMKQRWK